MVFNKLKYFYLIAICLIFFSPIAIAAFDESKNSLEDFSKKVVEKDLSNGLKVLFYQRKIAPIFAGVVMVGVGGVDEVPGETGISHMLEHMAFKGTSMLGTSDYKQEAKLLKDLEEVALASNGARDFSAEQLKEWQDIQSKLKLLWDTGALDNAYRAWGANGLNATTAKELTTYFVNFPSTALEFWAWIESERILNPVMRQFYKERDVVMEERRMRYEDNPSGKLYERMLGAAYLEHPYRNPVIGYENDLKGLLASNTLEFQRKYYVPKNMVISLVGDLDPDEVFSTLEKYFGRIPKGPLPERTTLVESEQHGERRVEVKVQAKPDIAIAYKKPNYPDPDDAPISVMNEMLAGGKISPLYKTLVQQKRVASGVNYFEAPGNRYPNLFIYGLTPRSEYSVERLINEFDKVVDTFINSPLSEEQLDIAKRSIAMAYLGSLSSNLSIAKDMASSQLIYGDWRAGHKWFDEVMAVSLEDVKKAADKYFDPDRRTIAFTSPIK